MEPHRKLPDGIERYRPDLNGGPRDYYVKAMAFAREFYGDEMRQIESVRFSDVTPEHFFQEYVWVVHATGFRASVVGKFMPRLVKAYGPWDRLAKEFFGDVMERVKAVCNNPQKARAVHATARLMSDRVFSGDGASASVRWREFRDSSLSDVEKLSDLPYIGKITRFHLARNIGLLECVKPDLHLVRMADHWGFSSCEEMCRSMREGEDTPLGIVDLALWYAASTFGTIGIRQDGQR